MRVLIIEDDKVVAQSLELILRSENINVTVSETGEDGAFLARHDDYDIILLDLGLPDISGHEVLRTLRRGKVTTPVMILSGHGGLEDRVKGIATGADDFLAKPFHKDELLVRLRAIIRRAHGLAQSIIEVDGILINMDARTVEANGRQVHLTTSEYEILELLALRKDKVLSKEMLLNHLYGGMDEPHQKIIDVFMSKLRKKLGMALWPELPRDEQSDNIKQLIATSWGRGYVLREPEELAKGS